MTTTGGRVVLGEGVGEMAKRLVTAMIAMFVVVAMVNEAPAAHAAGAAQVTTFSAVPSDFDHVTLTWATVGGYDNSALRLVYIHGPRFYPFKFVPRVEDVGFQPQSTNREEHFLKFRVDPGTHTYTLDVADNAGATTSRAVTVDVGRPVSPVVTTTPASGLINPLVGADGTNPVSASNPAPGATLAWAFDTTVDPAPGPVTITRPDGTTTPATSPFAISGAELASFGDIDQTWSVKQCKTDSEKVAICSDASVVHLSRAGAHFTKDRANAVGANPVVTWGPTTDTYAVTSPTLTLSTDPNSPHLVVTAGGSLTINAPPPGSHLLEIFTCHLFSTTNFPCASYNSHATAPGTVATVAAAGTEVRKDEPIATITLAATNPDGSPKVATVRAPENGKVNTVSKPIGSTVSKGDVLANLAPFSIMVLQVGETSTWTERSWTADFNPVGTSGSATKVFPVYKFGSAGLPLDVASLANGDTFSLGEFQSSVTQIGHAPSSDLACASANGTAFCSRDIPYFSKLVNTDWAGQVLQKTQPFFAFDKPQTASALGERVIEGPPGQVFFAQGGGGGAGNHSRIVRYNVNDGSSCAWGVPGDDNQVYGVAWDGTRIWFAESRIAKPIVDSVITSFKPATTPCSTNVDYQDPAQVAALQYCPPATPYADNCMTTLTISGSIGLTHLSIDPNPPAGTTQIWATESYGAANDTGTAPDRSGGVYKVVVNPTANTAAITRYPVPKSSRQGEFPTSPLGAFPWRIETDANFIYFSEFSDADLVRMPKVAPAGKDCTMLVNGKNPCMTELHVELRDSSPMNAIALHNGRLYFALASGQVGYANTSTWNGGVLYTGMNADLVEPNRRQVQPGSYNGISFTNSSASSPMVVSDFSRRVVIILTPKP
jgi:hypothetical protein